MEAFISEDMSDLYWKDVEMLLKENEELFLSLILAMLEQNKSLKLFHQNYSILCKKLDGLKKIKPVSFASTPLLSCGRMSLRVAAIELMLCPYSMVFIVAAKIFLL